MAKKTASKSAPKPTGSNKPARFAGVDFGGTKLCCVITNSRGNILARARKKTKGAFGAQSVMERIIECINEACAEAGTVPAELAAIGIGAPSPIRKDGTAVLVTNLGWKNVPLTKILSKHFGVPVFAENDCNAGTYGEYTYGAGAGAKTLVGLFMGTGLGGGIVLSGEIIRGENCLAAEVGHMVVREGGRKCGCGRNGCLEAYASKTGMGRRFAHEIIHSGRKSVLEDLCKGKYGNVKSSFLAEAWNQGDAVAVEALQEAARFLGIGVANMITLLGPDMVVLGGGVFEALGSQLIKHVKQAARNYAFPPISFRDTKIVLAKLGDDAVALGAIAFAISKLNKQ